jgi:IBR domain, a half RING-finger domain
MEAVARERNSACRLTEGESPSNVQHAESNLKGQLLPDEHLTELAALHVSGLEESQQVLSGAELDGGRDGDAELSNRADRRVVNPSLLNRRCNACWEERNLPDVTCLPCRHKYCRDCLDLLFRAAMTNESLFPPRCCHQPISITLVRSFLTSQLVQDFNKKKIEFETPDRTYCWSSTCAAFIEAENICGEVASCLECGSMTCTNCKEKAHAGDCPNDTALQQVLRTATEKEWQRCYSCWTLVELDDGCYHVTLVPLSPTCCHSRY